MSNKGQTDKMYTHIVEYYLAIYCQKGMKNDP